MTSHVAVLGRQAVNTTLYEARAIGDQDWDPVVQQQLEQADIILVLLSADFIVWYFDHGSNLTSAMERHAVGQRIVIPILLRCCDYSSTPFAAFEVLPTDTNQRTIAVVNWANLDEAFARLISAIQRVIVGLHAGNS
jgi:hypothetical protein